MVDLRRLRYFVVLAETLHFGKAALRLAIAQPPLSHQIRVLERELGAQLFERSNRRVELTSAGQALLPEARRLLEQAAKTAQVAARVERGEQGELRLGVVSTAALTQAVSRLILSYRQRWPGVRLHIEEFTTHEQLSAMVERRLDFAFVRGAQAPELPPASFGAVRLFDDALLAALPAAHRLAGSAAALSVGALRDEAFVIYPLESGAGIHAQIMALCHQAGFAPQVVQEARSATTIIGLVAAGLGVSLVPESFKSIAVQGVTYRPLREKKARSAMWLVHRNEPESAVEREFLALAGVAPFAGQARES